MTERSQAGLRTTAVCSFSLHWLPRSVGHASESCPKAVVVSHAFRLCDRSRPGPLLRAASPPASAHCCPTRRPKLSCAGVQAHHSALCGLGTTGTMVRLIVRGEAVSPLKPQPSILRQIQGSCQVPSRRGRASFEPRTRTEGISNLAPRLLIHICGRTRITPFIRLTESHSATRLDT